MLAFVLICGAVLLIIGLAGLTKTGRQTPPPRRRERDHDGSGVVMLDGAPLPGPDGGPFDMSAGAIPFEMDDDHERRFLPGGGSGGGAGASGGWDDADDDRWDDSGDDGGDGGDD